MDNRKKTKQQLTNELTEARRRIHTFEAVESLHMKETEAALLENEQRFRVLAEATSDWMWEVDPAGVHTYASPKVRDLLGYDPEEIIGKTPFDLMPPEEASRVRAIFLDHSSSIRLPRRHGGTPRCSRRAWRFHSKAIYGPSPHEEGT